MIKFLFVGESKISPTHIMSFVIPNPNNANGRLLCLDCSFKGQKIRVSIIRYNSRTKRFPLVCTRSCRVSHQTSWNSSLITISNSRQYKMFPICWFIRKKGNNRRPVSRFSRKANWAFFTIVVLGCQRIRKKIYYKKKSIPIEKGIYIWH